MSQRKDADLWRKIVAEGGEEEIERAASVSVEQAEAELRAAGFDVAAERAKANAFLEALERGGLTTPTPTPEPKRRTRPGPALAWLAAAASFAAGSGATYALLSEQLVGTSAPADLVRAAELRGKATVACDAKQWSVCLAELDQARAVDPRGDSDPAAKSLRDKATAEILKNPEAPPR